MRLSPRQREVLAFAEQACDEATLGARRARAKDRHARPPLRSIAARRPRCGRLRAVNFTEDVLERFPASKPALLAISDDGERRVWHFGELIAMSAGLSGRSRRAASAAATWS